MKYQVQISYTNPSHEHVSLRRKVDTITRIVEASSEEEALNRATNQQRALGFIIKEATVLINHSNLPSSIISESKDEEMEDDEDEEDDEEDEPKKKKNMKDDDEEETEVSSSGGVKEEMRPLLPKQKAVAARLTASELAANKEKAGYKYGRVLRATKVAAKKLKEESELEYIEEKLSAADPASKWISDFVASDNPKFAGKSKKERIQMALGAHYAAKRAKNEAVEIEEGFDTDPKDIAAYLVDRHGKGKVTMDHIEAYERRRDSNRPIEKNEVMKHVKKMSEEIDQIDEGMMKALKKAQTQYKSAHRAAFGKDPTVKSAIVTGIAKLAGAKTKTARSIGAAVGGKQVSKQQQAAAASRVGKKGMFGMREEVVEKVTKGKKAAEKMTTKAAEARKKKIEGSANKVNMKPVMDLNKTGEK
jgi:hypothetical protein